MGCGEILRPMLLSFAAHHSTKYLIHVLVYEEDLAFIPKLDCVIPVVVSAGPLSVIDRNEVELAYTRGHRGTALAWTRLIAKRDESLMIHLDSDSVFLDDVVTEIFGYLRTGYAIVGPRRPYRHGPKMPFPQQFFKQWMPDAVHTYAFGFNRELLAGTNQKNFSSLIFGAKPKSLESIIRPNLDFFDRATRLLSKEKRGIRYLDDQKGVHGKHSYASNFDRKMISFSAVGSGCAFSKRGVPDSVSKSYGEFALASYGLYASHLLGEVREGPHLQNPWIESQLEKLDTSSWSIVEG